MWRLAKLTLWVAEFTLWVVPVLTYRYARRNSPSHVWCATGIAVEAVASPASFGTYSFYWLGALIGPLGLPLAGLGILGLMLTLLHGAPGFYLATILGLRGSGVVHGFQYVYIEFLNAVVWAVAYGAIGWALDFVIRRTCTEERPQTKKV
jgi:hypothetical protein